MPLDFQLWDVIVERMIDEAPTGTETKDDFSERLRRIAIFLPRGTVSSAIGRMKTNVKALLDAQGYVSKND